MDKVNNNSGLQQWQAALAQQTAFGNKCFWRRWMMSCKDVSHKKYVMQSSSMAANSMLLLLKNL